VNMYWLVDFGRLMYGRKWGGELDVMWSWSTALSTPWRPRLTKQHIFTLRMATSFFAETLDNSQYSAWLMPESWTTLNVGGGNQRSRITATLFRPKMELVWNLRKKDKAMHHKERGRDTDCSRY
jgi:hypothetical protein